MKYLITIALSIFSLNLLAQEIIDNTDNTKFPESVEFRFVDSENLVSTLSGFYKVYYEEESSWSLFDNREYSKIVCDGLFSFFIVNDEIGGFQMTGEQCKMLYERKKYMSESNPLIIKVYPNDKSCVDIILPKDTSYNAYTNLSSNVNSSSRLHISKEQLGISALSSGMTTEVTNSSNALSN